MVDERKDRERDAGADGQAAAWSTTAYSGRDLDHFERLSDFSSHRGAAEASTGGAGPGPADAAAFAYSNNDMQAFSRLMDDLGQVRSVATRSRGTGAWGDYSAGDAAQFSALMAPERFAVGGSAAPRGAGPSSDPADAVAYSVADRAAFARIMPDATATEEGGATESWLPSDKDRDVGPIRVVEFGDDQARSSRRDGLSDVKIKVRYFD